MYPRLYQNGVMTRRTHMRGVALLRWIILLLASSICGAVGWELGSWAGTFTAFSLSVIGTAIGIYIGRWVGREYLL
jgi:hypothetical protein